MSRTRTETSIPYNLAYYNHFIYYSSVSDKKIYKTPIDLSNTTRDEFYSASDSDYNVGRIKIFNGQLYCGCVKVGDVANANTSKIIKFDLVTGTGPSDFITGIPEPKTFTIMGNYMYITTANKIIKQYLYGPVQSDYLIAKTDIFLPLINASFNFTNEFTFAESDGSRIFICCESDPNIYVSNENITSINTFVNIDTYGTITDIKIKGQYLYVSTSNVSTSNYKLLKIDTRDATKLSDINSDNKPDSILNVNDSFYICSGNQIIFQNFIISNGIKIDYIVVSGNLVKLKQDSSTGPIQYSTGSDSTTWITIDPTAWPLIFISSDDSINPTNPLTISLETNITLPASNYSIGNTTKYCIIIGQANTVVDGQNHWVDINGQRHYGFVQNGCGVDLSSQYLDYVPGYANCTVKNLGVISQLQSGGMDTERLEMDSGFICCSYFARGALNNLITNCFSKGVISRNFSAGIVGSYAGSNRGELTITNSYSIGKIKPLGAGIIGQRAGQDGGSVIINSCYSTWPLIRLFGNLETGGILAREPGLNQGTVTVSNCYFNGLATQLYPQNVPGYADTSTAITSNGNYGYEGTWSDTVASNNLSNGTTNGTAGNIWTRVSAYPNTPWLLTSQGKTQFDQNNLLAPFITSVDPVAGMVNKSNLFFVAIGYNFIGIDQVKIKFNGSTTILTRSAIYVRPGFKSIEISPPASSIAGPATITINSSISGLSNTIKWYYNAEQIQIGSVSTNSGFPGNTIAIRGSGFIKSGQTTTASFYFINSSGQEINDPATISDAATNEEIKVSVPQTGLYGLVKIAVSNGTSTAYSQDFECKQTPSISNIQVDNGTYGNYGKISGGYSAYLLGSNLYDVKSIKFKRGNDSVVSCTNFYNAGGQIYLTVPDFTAYGAGFVDIELVSASGSTVKSNAFVYIGVPQIKSISLPGYNGAVVLTGDYLYSPMTAEITGYGIQNALAQTFGTITRTIFVQGGNTVSAIIPSDFLPGTLQIKVTNIAGTSDSFSYTIAVKAPEISDISPKTLIDAGGKLTISGKEFYPNDIKEITVKINSNNVVIKTGSDITDENKINSNFAEFVDTKTIKIRLPAYDSVIYSSRAVSISIYIKNSGGNVSNTISNFRYIGVPTITSVSPSEGNALGLTPLTITGSEFYNVTGIKIGGNSATNLKIISPNSITLLTPSKSTVTGTSNTPTIDINTLNYPSTIFTNKFTYINYTKPTIFKIYKYIDNSISNEELKSGSNNKLIDAVLVGNNFYVSDAEPNYPLAITFDGVDCAVFSHSTNPIYETTIRVTTVTNNDGTTTTSYTIVTNNVGTTTTTTVTNNDGTTTTTSYTVYQCINFIIPKSNKSGYVPVKIKCLGGESDVYSSLFRYVGFPTITSVDPSIVSLSNPASVTITGTEFYGLISIKVRNTIVETYKLGTTIIDKVTYTTIEFVPPGAFTESGNADILIQTESGTATATQMFFYAGPPTIRDIQPRELTALSKSAPTVTIDSIGTTNTVAFGTTTALPEVTVTFGTTAVTSPGITWFARPEGIIAINQTTFTTLQTGKVTLYAKIMETNEYNTVTKGIEITIAKAQGAISDFAYVVTSSTGSTSTGSASTGSASTGSASTGSASTGSASTGSTSTGSASTGSTSGSTSGSTTSTTNTVTIPNGESKTLGNFSGNTPNIYQLVLPRVTGTGQIRYFWSESTTGVGDFNSSTGVVRFDKAGSITIEAFLLETDNYLGDYKKITISVGKSDSELNAFTIGNQIYSPIPFTFVKPTIKTGNGTISYSVTAGATVATIDSVYGIIQMLQAGSVTITATLSATDQYNSTSTTASFTINEAQGLLSDFPPFSTKTETINNQDYYVITYSPEPYAFNLITKSMINNTYQSDGTITYNTKEMNTGFLVDSDVASILLDSNLKPTNYIQMKKAGIFTLTAELEETARFLSDKKSIKIRIEKAQGVLSQFNPIGDRAYSSTKFTPNLPQIVPGANGYKYYSATNSIEYSTANTTYATVNSSSGAIQMNKANARRNPATGEVTLMTGATPVTITATLSETDQYLGATVSSTFKIYKAESQITWTNYISKTFNDSNFVITAPTVFIGPSSPIFTYTFTDENGTVIDTTSANSNSIIEFNSSTGTITIKKSGKIIIKATLAETDNYLSSSQTQMLEIIKDQGTIGPLLKGSDTTTNYTNQTITMGFTTYTFNISTIVNHSGIFEYVVSDISVLELTDVTVPTSPTNKIFQIGLKQAGRVTITFKLKENENYFGTQKSITFNITKPQGTISDFPSIGTIEYNPTGYITQSLPTVTFGDGTIRYAIIEPADREFAVISNDTNCTIHMVKASEGKIITVSAILSETPSYLGQVKTSTFSITKKPSGITNFTIENKTFNSMPFNFTRPVIETSSDGELLTDGTVGIEYTSSDPTVASINKSVGTITMIKAGTVNIIATLPETSRYLRAIKTARFTINKATSEILPFQISTREWNSTPFTPLDFTSRTNSTQLNYPRIVMAGNGIVRYSSYTPPSYFSADTDSAYINPQTGQINMRKAGITTIQISISETPQYLGINRTVTFTVVHRKTTVNPWTIGIVPYQYPWTIPAPVITEPNGDTRLVTYSVVDGFSAFATIDYSKTPQKILMKSFGELSIKALIPQSETHTGIDFSTGMKIIDGPGVLTGFGDFDLQTFTSSPVTISYPRIIKVNSSHEIVKDASGNIEYEDGQIVYSSSGAEFIGNNQIKLTTAGTITLVATLATDRLVNWNRFKEMIDLFKNSYKRNRSDLSRLQDLIGVLNVVAEYYSIRQVLLDNLQNWYDRLSKGYSISAQTIDGVLNSIWNDINDQQRRLMVVPFENFKANIQQKVSSNVYSTIDNLVQNWSNQTFRYLESKVTKTFTIRKAPSNIRWGHTENYQVNYSGFLGGINGGSYWEPNDLFADGDGNITYTLDAGDDSKAEIRGGNRIFIKHFSVGTSSKYVGLTAHMAENSRYLASSARTVLRIEYKA